jgi:hypothetical protein
MRKPKLVIVEIRDIEDQSHIVNSHFEESTIDVYAKVRFIGSGDFSMYKNGDSVDVVSIMMGLFTGNVEISKNAK